MVNIKWSKESIHGKEYCRFPGFQLFHDDEIVKEHIQLNGS